MDKTYISALMVVLMAGARMAQAQESLDDVFAQLDSANGNDTAASSSDGSATVVEMTPAQEASKLDALYKKGRSAMRSGDYEMAQRAFESMIAIDQYNTRAATQLKRTAQLIASRENKKSGCNSRHGYGRS